MPNHIRLLIAGAVRLSFCLAHPRLPTCTARHAGTPGGMSKTGLVDSANTKSLRCTKVKLPPNTTVIDTNGVIAPGFIDLHNHLTYNMFPRWHPIEEFGNRLRMAAEADLSDHYSVPT